jgi:hypothetical protein
MKKSKILALVTLFALNACGTNQETTAEADEVITTETTQAQKEEVENNQTIPTRIITVDEYFIGEDESLIEGKITEKSKVSKTYQSWFTNSEKNETLIRDTGRYADNVVYHFNNQNIPASLIELVTLSHSSMTEGEGEPYYKDYSSEETKTYISEFATQGAQVTIEQFVTQKGIKLGADKSKLIDLYGKPQTQEKNGNVETLKWKFSGDFDEIPPASIEGTIVVKDAFGYAVIAFVEDGKLIAQVLNELHP